MDTYQLFTTMRDHMLAQGTRSVSNAGCAYRGFEGGKCAVGFLIKDEHYLSGLEGKDATFCGVQNAVAMSIGRELTGRDIELLMHIQGIHDNTLPSDWKYAFADYERKYFNEHFQQRRINEAAAHQLELIKRDIGGDEHVAAVAAHDVPALAPWRPSVPFPSPSSFADKPWPAPKVHELVSA